VDLDGTGVPSAMRRVPHDLVLHPQVIDAGIEVPIALCREEEVDGDIDQYGEPSQARRPAIPAESSPQA